ncbi:EamA family transporter [Glycomyces sp. NPDC046736]|uniref:EamA family transporter n=1 Tax=Glycomyces sp. NPDC046736 TaxID=3155615 RepID=UPI0033C7B6CA
MSPANAEAGDRPEAPHAKRPEVPGQSGVADAAEVEATASADGSGEATAASAGEAPQAERPGVSGSRGVADAAEVGAVASPAIAGDAEKNPEREAPHAKRPEVPGHRGAADADEVSSLASEDDAKSGSEGAAPQAKPPGVSGQRSASNASRTPSRRAVLLAAAALIGATLFWAGNYLVGASAVATIEPLSLVLLRWGIALVPLLVIAQIVERPDWRAVLRAWPWLLVLSEFGMLGYNLFLYAALEHTTALSASLVNAFNPALITLAAAVFLRERLTPLAIGGVVIALVGVLVVLGDGDPATLLRGGFGLGETLMLGAIAAWTAYTVIGRRGPRLPPVTSTAVQAFIAVVALAPISLATGGPTLPASGGALWSLLFIAVFPSVLSYLLWNHALTAIPPGRAGVFLNLITVFTAAFTILAGDPYTASQIIGGTVVIGGVVLANARAFRKAPKGSG